jgi:hypothetical protein
MNQEGSKVGTPEAGGASRLGALGDGGPAFPCDVDLHQGFRGMSLRDYLAAKAMQGLLANPDVSTDHLNVYASDAYLMADAMIAARGAA